MFTRPKVKKPETQDRDVIGLSSRPRRDQDIEPSRLRRYRNVPFFQTLDTDTFNLQDRDVPKNVSRSSRDRDVQNRDYISGLYPPTLFLRGGVKSTKFGFNFSTKFAISHSSRLVSKYSKITQIYNIQSLQCCSMTLQIRCSSVHQILRTSGSFRVL